MKTLEFESALSAEGTLQVPLDVVKQLEPRQSIKVIVVVGEDSDDKAAWMHLTAEQFFKGYADSDAIYDNL